MRTFSGDIDIFYEIFWKHVYEIPFKFPNEIKTIVDLGAHIGFASIFFRTKFPDSKIYAVEASKENYILLKDNLKNFKNTHHLHAAIFTEDGSVKFNDSGFSYNSKLSSDGESIDAISMNTLMKKNNIEKINLLKIDIEGAEKLILKENNTWLENVENIIIEIHDDYTIKNLEEDLQKFGFTIYEPSNQLGSLKNIFATKLHLNI
jgi:FkbM family methyltransferase